MNRAATFSLFLLSVLSGACGASSTKVAAFPDTDLKITPENATLLPDIGKYANLRVLSISCLETLQAIPDSIGSLTKLEELNMDNGNGCAMNPTLPESLGNLRSLQKLVLFGSQDPSGDGVQPHQRHKFPASLSQLKNLTYLDLGRNDLDEMPAFVKDLPKLKWLHFGYNDRLKRVPEFLANLHDLEMLGVASDGLDDLPDFLNTMPKMTRVLLGNNCAITQNEAKMKDLRKRFPKIDFDFMDQEDCPGEK
jgi:Leucine-rich repeat (LRR) protein